MRFVPSLVEERLLATNAVLRVARRRDLLTRKEYQTAAREVAVEWKSFNGILRVALFGVTFVLLFLLMRLFDETGVPAKGVITCLMALAIAEFLIVRKKFFRGGIDEALYLGGLLAFIAGLPGEPAVEAWLLVAGACLLAGIRLLQPLFLAAVPAVIVYYVSETAAIGGAAGWLALGFATAAAILLIWRSLPPFLELAASITTVLLPLLAYAAFAGTDMSSNSRAGLFLAFSAALLTAGLLRRHHALVTGGLLISVFTLFELAGRVDMQTHTKLILFGVAAAATGLLLDRRFRARGLGISTARSGEGTFEPADAIVSESLLPSPPAEAPDGGGFGGGGASGQY